MVVQLSILVGNVDYLLGLGYTRAEVWVSEDEGNSYQEATAATASAAFLDSAEAQNTFQAGGRLLKFSINEGPEQSVSFSSVLPSWTPAQIAARINEVAPGRASVVGTKVRLTSSITGRMSSINITYSDIPDLGWSGVPIVHGHDARITLVTETYSYTYEDLSGKTSYRYKWRFTANGIPPLSDFSKPVYGTPPSSIDDDNLSVATATFVGMDGVAVKQKLIIAMVSPPQSIQGFIVTSMLPKVVQADDSGYLQLVLVRGTKVRVAMEGTAFVREFTVPDEPIFDILQAMADAIDPFTVQTPLPFLIRRSI